MAKSSERIYHILFWVIFIGLDQLLELLSRGTALMSLWSILQTIAFTLLQMIIFYLNYSLICPKTIPSKRWLAFAGGQLSLILLFPALRFLGEEVIIYNITGQHNYNEESRHLLYYLYDNSFYVLRIVLLSIVFYMIRYTWDTNSQVSQLTVEKKQAELQVLKNQLSPHFLFNTLNSFYADLYESRPEVAAGILQLSEMLRYVTYENKDDMVLLKDEITFIQNYIDLLKRRFDNAVSVSFTYPEDVAAISIPSLLLIHFVENAFKHGTLGDRVHPIAITLSMQGNRLRFSVANSFNERQHYDEAGIGHKNIRQRLSLLFPNDHTLKVTEDSSRYNILLEIPIVK